MPETFPCGEPIKGKPFKSTPPGDQFCYPARGSAFRTGAREVTDPCGTPILPAVPIVPGPR